MSSEKRTAYSELLKHPKWQRARLERLEAAGWACETCAATQKNLQVHHKQYVRGRLPWDYAADELEVLCEDCHGKEHGIIKARRTLRPVMRQPADRIAWLLLLENRWWETLSAAEHALLCALPGWHGQLFSFIDLNTAEHGPVPWAALRERIAVEAWSTSALALVAAEDPAIDPVFNDLKLTIRQFSNAPTQQATFRRA